MSIIGEVFATRGRPVRYSTVGAFWAAACILTGCGAGQAQWERMEDRLQSLQSTVARQGEQLEGLRNDVRVLRASKSASSVATVETPPLDLKVVHLTPEKRTPQVRTIVIESDSSPESLPVVKVPPVPSREKVQFDSGSQAQKALFSNSLKLHATGNWEAALEQFKLYLRRYPRGAHVPSVLFWMGECYVESQAYIQAVEAFEAVYTTHPKSTKASEAMLKTGLIFKKLKAETKAKKIFHQLLNRYPTSPMAAVARQHVDKVSGDSP